MHHFTIFIRETVPQFNDNLKNRFNKEKGYKKLKQLKSFSQKIQEATSKSVAITEKKGKQNARKMIYNNQEHSPTKFTCVTDFTGEPVVQCDVPVPVVEKMIKTTNNRYKLLQTNFDVNAPEYSALEQILWIVLINQLNCVL